MARIVFFFFLISLIIILPQSKAISAIFSFGDSSLDSGNNDYTSTILRSDHQPYGRDFTGHVATGRFSNGKLLPDYLISNLGIKNLIPPYLDPSVKDIELTTGVCFASAGSGFDPLTSQISNVISIPRQIDYFRESLNRMSRAVGKNKTKQIVKEAMFSISSGSNDMLWNFYVLPTRKLQYSMSAYQDFILGNLKSTVQRLYGLEGRLFTIAGLPPIGCLPLQITTGSLVPSSHMLQRVCIQQQNEDSVIYNSKLQKVIHNLQSSLKGATIIYVDTYNPLMEIINNPKKYGIEETSRGCCGTGLIEMASMCNSLTPVCPDPSRFVFWDAVHPTQKVYQILANNFLETLSSKLT